MIDGPVARSPGRPALWIAALPLLLIPCCWLYWWAAGLNPGIEIGRSADVILLAGCVAAVWAVRTISLPAAAMPLMLACAWQAMALLWAPVREPGTIWLIERAAACATALALARWAAHGDAGRLIAAAGLAGSGILAMTALTQYHEVGDVLRIRREAPFGNVNFAVGAALPLVALGLSRFLSGGGLRWWLWAIVTAGCAGTLAGGWLGGDPCRAVWLGGLTALASVLVLKSPRAWHGPLLIAGGGAVVIAWLVPVFGWADPSSLGAGSAQRVHIWRGTFESLSGAAALIGHGPAAIIATLPEQSSYAALWLTVPSYAAHAHCEPLQILSDGGLVLAALLGWALLATLRPLWHRRDEPAVAALLAGWCTAGVLSMIESHLSQPGGLLCLAVLAGLSWAVAGSQRPMVVTPWIRALPAVCALALTTMIVRELAADGGGPVGIEARSTARLTGRPAEDLAELDRLRARLGPLDNLDERRARCLGRLGRLAESDAALAAHLRRNPGEAGGLILARRRIAGGSADPSLVAAAAAARARAADLLGHIRRNPVNGAALDALAAELNRPAGGDPDPAR